MALPAGGRTGRGLAAVVRRSVRLAVRPHADPFAPLLALALGRSGYRLGRGRLAKDSEGRAAALGPVLAEPAPAGEMDGRRVVAERER